MKIKNQILALGTIALLLASCDKKETSSKDLKDGKTTEVELKTAKDSLSYALGSNFSKGILNTESTLEVGDNINQDEVIEAYKETLELLKDKSHSYRQGFYMAYQVANLEKQMDTTDILVQDLVIAGLVDGLNKAEIIDDNAGQMAFQKYLGPLQEKTQAKLQKRSDARKEILKKENEEKGNKFIAKKKEEGYKETESGLLYKVIQEGDASQKPSENDVAKVIYTGKLINGKEFDSSNGEVRDLPVGRMVPGFKEALQMMGKGSKMEIIMPAKLGYGEEGNQRIEPNSTLVFDVELKDFGPAPKNQNPPQLTPEQMQQMMQQQQRSR